MATGRCQESKEKYKRASNREYYIPMRYAPDILVGVKASQYVDFIESDSVACS